MPNKDIKNMCVILTLFSCLVLFIDDAKLGKGDQQNVLIMKTHQTQNGNENRNRNKGTEDRNEEIIECTHYENTSKQKW